MTFTINTPVTQAQAYTALDAVIPWCTTNFWGKTSKARQYACSTADGVLTITLYDAVVDYEDEAREAIADIDT